MSGPAWVDLRYYASEAEATVDSLTLKSADIRSTVRPHRGRSALPGACLSVPAADAERALALLDVDAVEDKTPRRRPPYLSSLLLSYTFVFGSLLLGAGGRLQAVLRPGLLIGCVLTATVLGWLLARLRVARTPGRGSFGPPV